MSTRELAINVPGGSFTYRLGDDTFEGFGPRLKRELGHARKAALIIGETCDEALVSAISAELDAGDFIQETFALPAGEELGSLAVACGAMDEMAMHDIRNRDVIVALGDQAIIDTACFIAALYGGGCELALVPTTLDAMQTPGLLRPALNLPNAQRMVEARTTPQYVNADFNLMTPTASRDNRLAFARIAQLALVNSQLEFNRVKLSAQHVPTNENAALLESMIRSIQACATIAIRDSIGDVPRRLREDHFGITVATALKEALGARALSPGDFLAEGLRLEVELARHFAGLDDELADGTHAILDDLALNPQPFALTTDELIMALRATRPRRTRKIYLSLPCAPATFKPLGFDPDDLRACIDEFLDHRRSLLPFDKQPHEVERRIHLAETEPEDEEEFQ